MDWIRVLGPTLLVVAGGFITWLVQSRIERLRRLEETLREDRTEIYGKILEPYIRLLTDLSPKSQQQASKVMLSLDYKRTAFNLVMLGSDEVVRSWNDFMQYLYRVGAEKEQDKGRELMRRFGALLLTIRKSLGNKKTDLDEIEMLRWLIKDIDAPIAAPSRAPWRHIPLGTIQALRILGVARLRGYLPRYIHMGPNGGRPPRWVGVTLLSHSGTTNARIRQ